MSFIIKHYKDIRSINNKWIYIGKNSKNLYKLKKIANKTHINILEDVKKNFQIYKDHYFEFIEKNRLANRDSLEWWMTDIANGNTMVSHFYLLILKLITVDNLMKSKEFHETDIIIVCEDIFILKLFKKNLPNLIVDQKWYVSLLRSINEKIKFFIKFLVNIYIQIAYVIKALYFTKLSLRKEVKKPKGDIILFHQILQVKNQKNQKIISGNYQKFLPKWFLDRKFQVYQLCMNYDLDIDKKNLFSLLRKQNFFFPEDWLSMKDYIVSVKRAFNSLFTLKYSFTFDGYDVNDLVTRERFYQCLQRSFIYFRYLVAIEKWSENTNSITYFDNCEGTVYQQPMFYALNNLNNLNKTRGLIHHYVSKEYLGHHSHKDHWKSKVKPKKVFCHSYIYKKILEDRNFPSNRVIVAPPIRSRQIDYESYVKNEKNILVNLPLENNAFNEVLLSLKNINEQIAELDLNIIFRLHPQTSEMTIFKLLGKMPDNWKIVDGELYDILKVTYCCIAISTASVYDAINLGCIIIPLKSEINIMDNYLDIFEDQFPILKSVDKIELLNTIKKVYFDSKLYYKREFEAVRIFLKNQSVKDSKNTMKLFLK